MCSNLFNVISFPTDDQLGFFANISNSASTWLKYCYNMKISIIYELKILGLVILQLLIIVTVERVSDCDKSSII